MKAQSKKIALFTQVNDQLSLANAQFLGHAGFNVAITASTQTDLSTAVEFIGHGAMGILNESENIGGLFTIYQKVACYFGGRINLLLLNANISFQEITDFSEAYFTIQYALPYLDPEAVILLNTGLLTREILSSAFQKRKKQQGLNTALKCELPKPLLSSYFNDIKLGDERS
ncbi:SDR family oxidoreductase [Mucilaginibacter polytrichastri]|uniref:Uncharacterized protein n=1 Tax=Mucilaginibacter polytrichastri TaxID=1302689 RepID=A0A1Q6A276_9SPHI|nr:hypothetical protein [Mucilaginibacter polytrichastri]OKS88116.1 hypothetical protein RG47T_3580 [Mucilaginibacter polytrichastri]SFT09568.1 hypothetical protein SAMN04487890_110125 [Mucilaginibacter polytrichastri]